MVAMKAATDNAGNADRRAAADLQQDPPGRDHQGTLRDRRRRGGGLSDIESEATRNIMADEANMAPRQDRPVHRRGRRRRIPARRDAARSTTRCSKMRQQLSRGLTLEVQQQLGDGVVRTIALGSSDGLRRGMMVHEHRRADLGAGRHRRRSGRIMDVLGRPIDERGPVEPSEHRADPPHGADVTTSCRRRSGAARDRHQGDRPDLPVRQGRQGRPVRRRRRRQDREHAGADQQHRQGSTRACRCSPASASARARATTSITR